MKKFYAAALSAFILLSLPSCRKVIGVGPVVTEYRNTSNFNEISSGIPGELVYIPSNEYKIEIRAQQNILNVLETYVSHNELKVKVRDNTNIRGREDIRVTVWAPAVSALSISGSGSINVSQPYAPAQTRLKVSGSGRIVINTLETNSLEADISGSGDVQVFTGTAQWEDIAVSGSGYIDLLNVSAKKASTHTSGSGSIKLMVEEALDSKISGSGTVYYKGDPSVSSNISGSGRLVKL